MSCDDQFLQAQASFRTTEASTSLNYRTCTKTSNEAPSSSAEEESDSPKMWAYPTREEVGWFTDEKITYYFLSSFLSVSSEIQHPTSCLGRSITFASFAVKKIYTYYISFQPIAGVVF